MHSNLRIGMIGVMLLLTLTSVMGLSFWSTSITTPPGGEHRTPPDTPELPLEDEPACPDDFMDVICLTSGTGTDSHSAAAAMGIAIGVCQAKEIGECQESQAREMNRNKTDCESVKGCVFSYVDSSESCSSDSATDCTPAPGVIVTGTQHYSCVSSGYVDYDGYKCTRAVKKGSTSA